MAFQAMTEGYSANQIFNCDETGLYFKMLPGRTLASVHNQPEGTKKAKDRVTINVCANASGTIKLPLLLIGKAKTHVVFAQLPRKRCQLFIEIKKMLGSTHRFSEIGF